MRGGPEGHPGLGPRWLFRAYPHRSLIHVTQMRLLRQGMFTLFLLSSTDLAIKLHEDDVHHIKVYTGKKVGELSEGELIKAMRDLGISNRHVTQEELELSKVMRSVSQAKFDLLEIFTQKHEMGFLSDEEYEQKKAKILGLD